MINFKISLIVLFFVFAQIAFNSAGNTPYSKCLLKQTNVKIESLEIENCNSKKRCTLKQGMCLLEDELINMLLCYLVNCIII